MSPAEQKFRTVKGMMDIMPPESHLWQMVEDTAKRIFCTHSYHEIRTPIVEYTELFRRGVGEDTSVVEKEMYSFIDQGEDNLTIRPEGTASVVRAYIESGASINEPMTRYYYMGPMFRRERPQKGRFRQFYQIGLELLGVTDPAADAEIVAMTWQFLTAIGLKGSIKVELNSIGCKECRPKFNEKLVGFLSKFEDCLCEDCKRRIVKNPMRIFDCKKEACKARLKDAPRISKYWCEGCRTHFDKVQAILTNVSIPFVINETIVRGLDYYVSTAFEFISDNLGAQSAVGGGGRYDGLVRSLGGPDVAGVGIALGMERIILLLNETGKKTEFLPDTFFAVLGEKAKLTAFPIIENLRSQGLTIDWDYGAKSLKAQMRRAGKVGAKKVVIIGDTEIEKNIAIIKNMDTGMQQEINLSDICQNLSRHSGTDSDIKGTL